MDMVDVEGASHSANAANNNNNNNMEAGAIDMSLHPSGIIPTLQ